MPKLLDLPFPAGCERLPGSFWSAVEVWIKKPHVLNKRLCGAKETEGETLSKGLLQVLLEEPELSQLVMAFLAQEVSLEQKEPWSCTIRTIIPKVSCCGSNLHKELVVRDSRRQRVTFLPFEEDAEGRRSLKRGNIYQIQLVHQDCLSWAMELHALTPDVWFSDGVVYPNLGWLSSDLLPKLLRWAIECKTSEFKSTLSLLPLEKYSLMYQRLKDKYKAMVKVWPEVTDPEKFVYEDVAIATYLLVLWEVERADKGLADRQSFVDLGCGNGLLVHILTNEGHPGKGMDVRRRKIWHMYGSQTVLEEKAITPDESLSLAGTDWLIGNHSDELTPWIPVMAARSSYSCRYFVLPCCFFDFYGKYQRRQCQKSQYKEYIDFITEVSEKSGFNTEEDCLRIPSTKRVCLVGASRNYQESDEDQAEQRRAHYIQIRRDGSATGVKHQGSDTTDKGDMSKENCDCTVGTPRSDWGAGFRPREKVEMVRNCAALPRDFVEAVVLQVATVLLDMTAEGSYSGDWNPGGNLLVCEVAALLGTQTLQQLKRECGGLQTLLKNNYQVFRVEGGRVHIRDWRQGRFSRPNTKRRPAAAEAKKTRPCWFYQHHPQRCPLLSEHCVFAHGADDLRASTRPVKIKNDS